MQNEKKRERERGRGGGGEGGCHGVFDCGCA